MQEQRDYSALPSADTSRRRALSRALRRQRQQYNIRSAQQQAHKIRQRTRQERKADYGAVVRSYGQFADLESEVRMALRGSQDLTALNAQLDEAFIDLALAADGVHLLGPEYVWDAARLL
ncbi:hypothetical protein OHN75_01010 [Streptomyces sp. NBC_00484]|uniref:hypothetical protein n=1 Tax=unclassified Streptomyces TaxID=2593676 RepID=UPI002E1934CD